MYQKSTKTTAMKRSVMESGDHFKNGASLKSQMSKGNFNMKTTVLQLKTAIFIVFAAWSINSSAQVETLIHVMKNDTIVFHSHVLDIDNVTFDDAAKDDALIVQKSEGSPADTILLNNIQQLYFSDESLTVEMLDDSKVYVFEEIEKLLFGKVSNVGINDPSVQNSVDVTVFIAPTGEVIVESSVAIKLLRLFSTDGKMVSMQQCNGIEKRCVVTLQGGAAGIYLVQIETEQGTVVKKVVKPFNK